MKKIITLILCTYAIGIFAQSNLHDAKIIGSVVVGNKEITSVLDKITGCLHKSSLHTKGLFTVDESVQLEMGDNEEKPKIVKPNLPEVVFVDKCEAENDPFHEKRMEILKLSVDEQRVVFSELPIAFKAGIWKDKWKQVKGLNWTVEQLKWINDLEEVFIPALWTHNPPRHHYNNFQDNIKPSLEIRAAILFDGVTLTKLLDRLASVSINEPLERSGDCNVSSDFCSWSCNNCSCKGCYDCSSFGGCGWLWLDSCDGTCSQ